MAVCIPARLDTAATRLPARQRESTLLHFDCFYASVFERETPALKALPLAVQQKQIVVTCNYEARRRGLHKLQLITDAKQICPDVVIVLGEDLTRFRDASKELYAFFRSVSWNSRCERLGFDEVFMDVSDIIEYNAAILSPDLSRSFFCLSKTDPTVGFPFDATRLIGHVFPEATHSPLDVISSDPLYLNLLLASHLAHYLRERLETEKGYTATVGISTNKLLSKLVGNLHKPNAQTTLLPPYAHHSDDEEPDNVTKFVDQYEIGRIPGIGFKIAQKLRAHVLKRAAKFDNGLIYGGTQESVLVRNVRQYPDIGPESLERLLRGPGAPHGIGVRIWSLIHGCDDALVGQARNVPKQISIEDSYIRLNTLDQVVKELRVLARSLLNRMHADLLEDDNAVGQAQNDDANEVATDSRRWLAHPKTLRLSTRPRPPQNPDGSRSRSFARISKSAPMPTFVFGWKDGVESVADKLVVEILVPLFRRLHPEKSGWNLSLVNIAATNMVEAASENGGVGRDISQMFRHQDNVLKQWKVEVDPTVPDLRRSGSGDNGESPIRAPALPTSKTGSEDAPTLSQEESVRVVDRWESDDDDMADVDSYRCECGAVMPMFAMGPHVRWHAHQ